ncbi:MAG TPA: siderophore-interacting protein, partial [Phenylobacterium sp.]
MPQAAVLQADLPAPFPQMDPEMFRRRFGRAWTLEVVEAFDVTPKMRRVVYSAPDLDDFDHKPGQEVLLLLQTPAGLERRHYTIREADRAARRVSIDFYLHGDSPGARHGREAEPGETVTVLG